MLKHDMALELYQVDAFASQLFTGNPAAVCPLEAFLPDVLMQQIAAENNLSETTFFVPQDGGYAIRWFTPEYEIKLCGHATLAAAFIIFNYIDKTSNRIEFTSKSGPLYVKKLDDGLIQLDFPVIDIEQIEGTFDIADALGIAPKAIYRSADEHMFVYENKVQILSIQPDLNKLLSLGLKAVIVSSQSNDEYDFVSRFFAADSGVPEDPVTGSAHCILAPYWAAQLGKTILKAKQLSVRGGEILCEVQNDRVLLSGNAVLYMKGTIYI